MSENPSDSTPSPSSDNPWANPTSDSPQDSPATQPLPAPTIPPPPAYPPPVVGTPNAPTASSATTVMILGIVAIALTFTCGIGFIPAIIALVLSGNARREVLASGGALSGLSQIKTGKICSWISLGLTLLILLAVVLFFALVLTRAETGTFSDHSSPSY